PIGIQTRACVLDLDDDVSIVAREPDGNLAGSRVLRCVLEGLERAEVHGGLDLRWIATHAVRVDVRGEGRLASLRRERLAEALVGQERWIDPTGQVAYVL